MYVPYREETTVKVNMPWDRYTARGFFISLGIVLILISFISISKFTSNDNKLPDQNLIPITMLNFGAGDGTGMSKGNLSKEGAAHLGAKTMSELEDAKIAASAKPSSKAIVDDPENYQNLKASGDVGSIDKVVDPNISGNSSSNVGSPDGTVIGTGTGKTGFGPGAGEGLGDIEWGGGGNRTVLFKKLPKYPPGVNTQAQIRIRFTVTADGTVRSMYPLQKGDPMLERSAMDALRQWRFNPLKSNTEMYGIITFTFRLN
jgi:TonB family protein